MDGRLPMDRQRAHAMTLVAIISLPSAQTRRQAQEQQAATLGFEPVWITAVGVDDITEADFLSMAFSSRRPLKKTEVACFLSHRQTWAWVAQLNEPVAILEDDVILAPSFVTDITALSSLEGVDHVCLETWNPKVMGRERVHGAHTLRELKLNSAGAAGYLLWPSGAQRLLSKHRQEGVALADAFINSVSGWRSWQLVPANVVQQNVAHHFGVVSPIEAGSLISRETTASPRPPSLWVLFKMKGRRLHSEVIKLLWKMMSISHHQRAYVPFGLHQRNEN